MQAIQGVLGCSSHGAAAMLEGRMATTMELEEDLEILQSEGAMPAIDTHDAREVDNFVAEAKQSSEFNKQLVTKIRAIRHAAKPKARRPGVKFVPPQGEWTAELAQRWMPPNSTIARDDFNGRWRAYYGTPVAGRRWNKSMSCGPGGQHADCVMGLLRQAWAQHTSPTGDECPISGLQSASRA